MPKLNQICVLRTTGLDVTRDRIVELAAAHAPADGRLAGSSYSSAVAVDQQILQERGGVAAAVHGISRGERPSGGGRGRPIGWWESATRRG